MDLTADIIALLAADATVAALVVARIHPDVFPQQCVLPAIAVSEISGNSDSDLAGGSGFAEARVQIDCAADTRTAANAVAEAVRVALLAYRGLPSDAFICGVQCVGKLNSAIRPPQGSAEWRYLRTLDFLINHHEPVVPNHP